MALSDAFLPKAGRGPDTFAVVLYMFASIQSDEYVEYTLEYRILPD